MLSSKRVSEGTIVGAAGTDDVAGIGSSKIGMIVPSSNTTMETELPELFRRQSEVTGHRYTFHSARATLHSVTVKELAAMVDKAAECSVAVSDARRGRDCVCVSGRGDGPGAGGAHRFRGGDRRGGEGQRASGRR